MLEPVSKLFEEDNEAGKLDKAEESVGVVLPSNDEPALPLNPSEEALDEPAADVAALPSPILRGRLAAVAPMRRDHLDAVLSQLGIQRIAGIGAIADQVFRLGFDHVEVETQLHQTHFVMVRRVRADRERQSMAIHNRHDFHAFSTLVAPISNPPPLAMT